MNKDRIKGTVNAAAGKAQESLGKVTDNSSQHGKGLDKEVAGTARRIVGDAKAALKGATRKP